MCTVTKTAITSRGKDLPEIMTHLIFLKINRSETLNTRGVDDRAVLQEVHLRECRRVHAFVMGIGDLTRARHLFAEERIE